MRLRVIAAAVVVVALMIGAQYLHIVETHTLSSRGRGGSLPAGDILGRGIRSSAAEGHFIANASEFDSAATARAHHSTPAATAGPPRYLIVHGITYGRFSNNLMGIGEAITLARASNRVLVLPASMHRCGHERLDRLFNATALAASLPLGLLFIINDESASSELSSLCNSSSGRYLPLRDDENTAPVHSWKGMRWTRVPEQQLPYRFEDVLFSVRRYASMPNASWLPPPYEELFAPGVPLFGLPQLLTDHFLPFRIMAAPDACLLVGSPFMNVNFALLPSAIEAVTRATTPSPAIERAREAWMRANELSAAGVSAALGVHLRLTDIGNMLSRCQHAPSTFIAEVLQFGRRTLATVAAATSADSSSRRAGGALDLVLLATDDIHSPCAQLVISGLNASSRVVAVSLAGIPGVPASVGRCGEYVFIQDVLARTAALVGNGYSTFSSVVHQRRVVVYGARPNSTWFVM